MQERFSNVIFGNFFVRFWLEFLLLNRSFSPNTNEICISNFFWVKSILGLVAIHMFRYEFFDLKLIRFVICTPSSVKDRFLFSSYSSYNWISFKSKAYKGSCQFLNRTKWHNKIKKKYLIWNKRAPLKWDWKTMYWISSMFFAIFHLFLLFFKLLSRRYFFFVQVGCERMKISKANFQP